MKKVSEESNDQVRHRRGAKWLKEFVTFEQNIRKFLALYDSKVSHFGRSCNKPSRALGLSIG